MNSMILIRGNKIAFPRSMSSFGDDGRNAFDPKNMMFPQGFFIPCHDHGVQVMTMLDSDSVIKPHRRTEVPLAVNTGNKGILCTNEETGIQFNQIRVTDDRQVTILPLLTGEDGFAVIGPFDHTMDLMTMAVRLTKTIEDAVDMYCRHVPSNRDMVEIWDKKQVLAFMRKHHLPYIEGKLERLEKREKRQ